MDVVKELRGTIPEVVNSLKWLIANCELPRTLGGHTETGFMDSNQSLNYFVIF